MKLLSILAVLLTLASVETAYARNVEYPVPQSGLSLIVTVPKGWNKASEGAAAGELKPHAIIYRPAAPANPDDDEYISVYIWPATPNTKPFPEGYAKQLAITTLQIGEKSCDVHPQKPIAASNLLNDLPVAVFFSECWIKSDLLKAHPGKRKNFEAVSYFATAHDRTMLFVSHFWGSNDYGKTIGDLSPDQIKTLAKKSYLVMSLITKGVKLCNLSKTPVTCTSIAEQMRAERKGN